MEMINRHKGVLRRAMLILLLVAMVDPWFFSDDGMPPAEWCHQPNILLGNGSCVSLVSGLEIFSFMIWVSRSLIEQLVTDVIIGRIREYIIVFILDGLLLLLVQPIFSTFLLSYRSALHLQEEARRGRAKRERGDERTSDHILEAQKGRSVIHFS
jgi:hypothetical protein